MEKENYAPESPYITVDAANYLANKKVKLMAADFPMRGAQRDGMDFVPEDLEFPDYVLLRNKAPYLLGL